MSEQVKSKRSLIKKLDELRLLVAREIICYAPYRDVLRSYISTDGSAGELFDQYGLKILLIWLATKYGFPIFTKAISSSIQANLKRIDTCQPFANRYPFYSYFDHQFEAQLLERACNALDRACVEPRIELVGELYMQCMIRPILVIDGEPALPRADKLRRGGEFYTPEHVVDLCLSDAGVSASRLGTIIDPACGSGNFLHGLLRTAAAPAQAIYGCDADPRAVELARHSLLLSRPENTAELWQRQIVLADATTGVLPANHFDLVVTNPPYVSFGSRGQPPLHQGQAQFLRRAFPAGAEYKIRLHAIFQELCLNLAKPGGHVVLLLPDAFLNGAYYRKLRELIVQQAEILSLSELPESTFGDATAGRWCIAHYRKRGGSAAVSVNVRLRQYGEPDTREFVMPHSIVVSSGDRSRFRLVFNHADMELLALQDALAPVRESVRGHTGIRARHGQATVVSDVEHGPDWRRGIVSGAAVKMHELHWQGHYIHIKPELLFAGGFNAGIVAAPKVMVRQTADRLIGVLDRNGFYHLNNVHSFAPVGSSLESACIFAGLVNSRLWLYLYQLKSREHKRALAQIDIEMVESLPMPPCDERVERALCAAVLALPGMQPEDRLATMKAIDRAVYDWYRLDERLVTHIERMLMAQAPVAQLPDRAAALNLLESLAVTQLRG